MKAKTFRVLVALASVAITSATFAARQKSGSGNPLVGTSWQLVKFQGPDERMHTPDDKSKYTVSFGSNGRITARVDCNRASSSWKVNAKGELEFGSWSRTSTKCGQGSLHDVIVMEGGNVKNFEIKNGHLFLWGMAAGGWYELEPMQGKR